ncbi:MAG TPA: hypothetical protein VIY53_18845 [Acidobacteriaceae bacterium]
MHRRRIQFFAGPALLLVLAFSPSGFAQDSGFSLEMHANAHATAKEIGLPEYPGATPYKDKDSDSSANLGFSLNSFHIGVQVVSYVTADSPQQVLAFYRKPLAKYGEVLECDHGKPVGSLTVTKSGLTCGNEGKGHMEVNGTDSSTDHELRAGKPDHFWLVGIDDKAASGKTKFGLVELMLPKDTDSK